MKRFLDHINHYEDIIHKQTKIYYFPVIIQVKTFIIYTFFVLVSLGIGLLLGLWQNLSYLVVMSTLTVMATLLLHKVLVEQEKRKRQDFDYNLWNVLGVEIVYLMSTVLTTVLVLLLTAYSHTMNVLLVTVIAVLMGCSSLLYILIRRKIQNLDIASIIRVWINGIFIAILFYSLTMLLRIPNVPVSIFVTVLALYSLVEIRLWMEQRFVFHLNRYAVVFIGAFLVLLSFPFNQGFNIISLYRGEFSLRMVYEKYVDPVHTFDEEIGGDVFFYQNQLVIANEDTIQFFDEDFTLEKTVDHNYDYVYIMNGRLLANKEDTSSILYNDVYEWNGTDFEFVDQFFMQSTERPIFFDDNSYTASSGYVYQRLTGSEDYNVLPIQQTDELELVEQTEDYLLFNQLYPFFAHNDSFQDRVRGVNYKHIAYDNDHMILMYSRLFAVQNPEYVDPRDDQELVLYLTSAERYFSGEVYAPPAFVTPHLFVVDSYRYQENHHFLLGHVLYSSGEFKYSMLVLDDDANIMEDIMLENLNVAVSEDYIVLEDNGIEVYHLDADTGLNYRFIDGYGITFTVAVLVTLFAVEQTQVHPTKKNFEEQSKKNEEKVI